MRVPVKIKNLLARRARLAAQFNDIDIQLADWLEANDIEVEPFDIRGGCESYVNPWLSAKRIMDAIENK